MLFQTSLPQILKYIQVLNPNERAFLMKENSTILFNYRNEYLKKHLGRRFCFHPM